MAYDFSYPYILGTHDLEQDEAAETKWTIIVPVYRGKVIMSFNRQRQHWELPGGHCEHGETPEETAIRECFEETGGRVSSLYLIGRIPARRASGDSNLGLVYLAQIDQLDALPNDNEISRRALLPAQDINRLVKRPGAMAFYRSLLDFAQDLLASGTKARA